MDLNRLRIDRSGAPPNSSRRSRSRRGWTLLALALLAAVPVFLWAMDRTPTVTTAMAEFRGTGGGGGSVDLTANGYVVARTQASISSKIPGRLESLEVSEGSIVVKGEILATLENADYRAALRQAEAQLEVSRAVRRETVATRDQLRRDVRRGAELVADSLISTQAFEQLESSLTEVEARLASQEARILADQAAVEVARANLENTVIRAPFAGTVLRKDAEVGELVAPTNGSGLTRGAVVTMADLQSLEVEVDVNEAYIARVSDGQSARIVLDAYPTVGFSGEVRQVMPTADRQRATVQVKVAIAENDPRILPEMGARVEFLETAEAPAASETPRVVVPAGAVREEGGASIVWVVQSGRLERRPIEAGPVSGDLREVRSGLRGGERLVLTGPARLTEGMKVKVGSAG